MEAKQLAVPTTDFDAERILEEANQSLNAAPCHIVDEVPEMSEGGIHDYYSNGDYWWRDPDSPEGLPFIRRDGESNPECFHHHRRLLRQMRSHVSSLAAAYLISRKEDYACHAVRFLKEFFLDASTRMNPHLSYAQAIPGLCSGRGIGVIDTLHLVEVPLAIHALTGSQAMTRKILNGLKAWFADYLTWITEHPYGVEEMGENNNHGVCWHLQAAVFAIITGNRDRLAFCRTRFKHVIIPNQMALNGSFPAELARTRPYTYSIFQLDQVTALCHILSDAGENLWSFQLKDGRGIKLAVEYLYPYLQDKTAWPSKPDVELFEKWPIQQPCLLFAGYAYNENRYLELWRHLSPLPTHPEVRRNVSVRQPILWFQSDFKI